MAETGADKRGAVFRENGLPVAVSAQRFSAVFNGSQLLPPRQNQRTLGQNHGTSCGGDAHGRGAKSGAELRPDRLATRATGHNRGAAVSNLLPRQFCRDAFFVPAALLY